jgi:hypothetical protein
VVFNVAAIVPIVWQLETIVATLLDRDAIFNPKIEL